MAGGKRPYLRKRGGLTRPILFHFTADRGWLERASQDLFDAVGSGAVKIKLANSLPLVKAGDAHQNLEDRKTTGSTVLIPQSACKRIKSEVCIPCDYVYDSAEGDPDSGISPGTPVEDLPEDGECPICGVGKDQFEKID